MSETLLQELRRARSDALRERFADELMIGRRLVGCAGCGCPLDSYALQCKQCWERARHRVSRVGDPAARAWLAENKLEAVEMTRRRRTGNRSWIDGKRPLGAQGFRGYAKDRRPAWLI